MARSAWRDAQGRPRDHGEDARGARGDRRCGAETQGRAWWWCVTAGRTSERILDRLRAHGVTVASVDVERLARYYDLLLKWNTRINLTGLADGDEGIDRLVVEAVMAAQAMPETAEHLDIGSGGGSPALPVRVVRPQYRSVLVESRVRKVAFLREAVRCMPIQGVRVEGCRLDELRSTDPRFSLVTVRAVRVDDLLLRAVEGLVCSGAVLWYFAGPGSALHVDRAGWTCAGEHRLLPEKQSKALCFTWNIDLARSPE